jgi:hypothetical protein
MGGNSITPAPCSFCNGAQGMLTNFVSDVKLWASKPYDTSGSMLDWFLFVGLVLASVYLWSRVITAILREV